jgi:DNA-binding transcriptional LysR family regulator
MNTRDLSPELLRAFVAVVDGGGFTRAANRLNSTQSTVSQQIKRLEERLGVKLMQRNTRGVALTERGELMLGYSRRLLTLNDEALTALEQTHLRGRVRLGSTQEVADGGLADLLARFTRLHPDVELEMRVDTNMVLQQEVERGALDLAVLFQEPGQGAPGNEVIERQRRVWVSVPGLVINPHEPLPLILSNGPCIFRNSVLSALDAIGRSWRIVLSTPSLAGIRAGVRAGLGVCVRSERWLEEDLKVIDQGLPPLPDVELAILSGPNTGERVVERLRTALRGALSQVS